MRLWGVDAPEKAQLCQDAQGSAYSCGAWLLRYHGSAAQHQRQPSVPEVIAMLQVRWPLKHCADACGVSLCLALCRPLTSMVGLWRLARLKGWGTWEPGWWTVGMLWRTGALLGLQCSM